jgi:hypothetical protein
MRAFIWTCCFLLLSQAAAAQTTAASIDFTTPNRGGAAFATSGDAAVLQTGYARIQPSSTSSPDGVAIISLKSGGSVVTEAGVPAVTPMLSGRTFAEVNGPVNTGIAFANPGSSPVIISFYLTNQAGLDFSQRSFTLGAGAQIAAFLNEAPFNVIGTVLGTFTFTAATPVAAVALRGLTNARNEFLITTQTVTPLPASFATNPVIMPHFADGGGWQTQVILTNPGDGLLTGTVQFFGQGSPTASATPIALNVDGLVASSFNYTVRARSAVRLRTMGTISNVRVGSVRVTPSGGTRSPSGFLIFSFASGGVTVTEAGVPVQSTSIAWRMFVETVEERAGTPTTEAADWIQSGVAIANTSSTTATIRVELTTPDGVNIGQAVFLNIAGGGHAAKFLGELFPDLDPPFRAILRISSGTTQIAVAGLRGRYNDRGEFLITTTSPSDETGQTTTADLFFPHVADGGGYTTQFWLFSAVTSQNTRGTLRFFTRTGGPMPLPIED